MKKLFEKIRNQINGNELVKKVEELCGIERGQTFRNYHQSANHILHLLQEAGIPNVEKICFPADNSCHLKLGNHRDSL